MSVKNLCKVRRILIEMPYWVVKITFYHIKIIMKTFKDIPRLNKALHEAHTFYNFLNHLRNSIMSEFCKTETCSVHDFHVELFASQPISTLSFFSRFFQDYRMHFLKTNLKQMSAHC